MSRESAKAKYTRLSGDPEVGYISVPGVMERLQSIDGELTRNGGNSLKDQVVSNSRKLDELAQQTTGTEQPEALASVHMWRIVAIGPIADAYSYAVATDVPNPGKDQAVVTDANILAAVEAIVAPDTLE